MSNVSLKKRLIPWIPYVLIGLFATNLGEAWRLASGTDASQKLLGLMASIPLAFATPLPSFHPFDLLVGAVQRRAAAVGCLSQKQEREEIPQRRRIRLRPLGNPGRYCSLRRSGISAKRDLDQTERLTMSSRPKIAKYARNKNVLVIGGSGSGKTRFFVKPSAPVRAV